MIRSTEIPDTIWICDMPKSRALLSELASRPADQIERGLFIEYERKRPMTFDLSNPDKIPFGEWPDDAKAALFLAWQNGGKIEVCMYRDAIWCVANAPTWGKGFAYRLVPAPVTYPTVDWSHVGAEIVAFATDADGKSYGYSRKLPEKGSSDWHSSGFQHYPATLFLSFTPGTCDWKDSLIVRPGYAEKAE